MPSVAEKSQLRIFLAYREGGRKHIVLRTSDSGTPLVVDSDLSQPNRFQFSEQSIRDEFGDEITGEFEKLKTQEWDNLLSRIEKGRDGIHRAHLEIPKQLAERIILNNVSKVSDTGLFSFCIRSKQESAGKTGTTATDLEYLRKSR